MKKHRIIFLSFFMLCTIITAQEKNDLLDREFWKTQPSIETIQTKIDAGHSIFESTTRGIDAVVASILENNSTKTVAYLIEKGLDVNKPTHDNRTYIFWAGYKGNLELMEYLVSKGAKTDIVDKNGYSLLLYIANSGQKNTKLYDFCIKNGSDILNEKTPDGRNALLLFSQKAENSSQLNYFLNKGLHISSTDNNGNGIFNYASKTGNQELLEQLINLKANYKASTGSNENAFLFATRRGHGGGPKLELTFLKYLESLGLNPAITSTAGKTALHNIAYTVKDETIFNYFIEKGVNPNQADENNNIPLINVSLRNDKKSVEIILENTKHINHKNKDGYSALIRATRTNTSEVVQLLIDKGADITIQDNNGNNLAYHLVDAYRRNIDNFNKKVLILKENGLDFNDAFKKDGNTPLHIAVKKGKLDLIEEVLKISKGINLKNKDGFTVLHIAAMTAKNDEILKLLLNSGADKTIKTALNETVHDLAFENELLNKKTLSFLN